MVLFAAGNEGEEEDPSVRYPACLKEVIAVGASNVQDERASFSCYGPEVDVVTPGVDLWTTDIAGIYAGYNALLAKELWGNGNYFTDFGGTSGACPITAGLVGLILSLDPSLTAAQVQAMIQFSAEDEVGNPDEDTAGRDEYMGYGRINAADALDLVQRDRFVIKHEDGSHAASFDSLGNFVLEGGLIESAASQYLEDYAACEQFLIRDADEDGLVSIYPDSSPPSQMMFIAGKLYENVAVAQLNGVSVSSFRIKNAAGNTVALVNSQAFTNANIEPTSPYTVPAGSMILAGRAFLGDDPDRDSSQGE